MPIVRTDYAPPDPQRYELARVVAAGTAAPSPFAPARLIDRLGSRLRQRASGLALPGLRAALALVYVWFGVLKVLQLSPVGDLVAATVPWFDPHWFVPALGGVEVVLGIALLIKPVRVAAAVLIAGHLVGTFLVLVREPGISFQHGNPFLITTIGEFVIKNVVLIAAATVIATRGTGQPSSDDESVAAGEASSAR